MKTIDKLIKLLLIPVIILLVAGGCAGPVGIQGTVGPQGPTGEQGPSGATGAAGTSITNASVNSAGHLILTLTDGEMIDAGSVIGPQGPAGLAGSSGSSTQNMLVSMPSFADLISATQASVVEIDVSATSSIGRRSVQQQGAGSGWIMDSNGTIVTNNHVITGATSITVTTSDGKTFQAQLINTDPANDLALIKINASQLTSMKIGDASRIRSGDWVLAIGNPLGEGITAVQGIVSRLGVSVPLTSTQTYNNLIETSAPINPGNSGGPLINMAGEVIGITTLTASGVQGMGYAISMVNALPVLQNLSK